MKKRRRERGEETERRGTRGREEGKGGLRKKRERNKDYIITDINQYWGK